MIKKIGILQGRLTKIKNNRIQEFPKNNWIKEFKILNKIGLNKIEWLIDENFIENPLLNRKKLKEIKIQKEKHKIEINSVCCDNFMFYSFFEDKKAFATLKKLIINCSTLGIKLIDIPLLGKNSVKKLKKRRQIIKDLKKLDTLLKKKKITLTFETDLKPSMNLNFIKSFKNLKNFGLTYDTGNSTFWGYDYREEFSKFGKYIKNVHVKDCTKSKYSVPLGSGHTKFNQILKLLKLYNYKGDFIFQTARKNKNYEREILVYKNFFIKKLLNFFYNK